MVEELEALKKAEKEAEQEVRVVLQAMPDWPGLAAVQEAWQARRRKRATAELQLWLADRQWEREESEGYLEYPHASLTIKP